MEPETPDSLAAYRALYAASLRTFPEAAPAAIPVEQARANLLLIAGEDDALWPSEPAARQLAARRWVAARQVEVITHPGAGHRVILPGEDAPPPSTTIAHGGDEAADGELGARAWPRIQALLFGRTGVP